MSRPGKNVPFSLSPVKNSKSTCEIQTPSLFNLISSTRGIIYNVLAAATQKLGNNSRGLWGFDFLASVPFLPLPCKIYTPTLLDHVLLCFPYDGCRRRIYFDAAKPRYFHEQKDISRCLEIGATFKLNFVSDDLIRQHDPLHKSDEIAACERNIHFSGLSHLA